MISHRPTILAPKPVPGVAAEPPPCGSRTAELALVIFFLVLMASVLVIQTTIELLRGEGVRAVEVFRQKPTSANLRAYERNLEDASVVASTLRPWFQFAQFAWLRDGGEKALVGRDGWLYYKPGFDDMVARGSGLKTATKDPVATIVGFREELAARGIDLLVVPVPNKESVYPDRLTRRIPAGQSVISPTTQGVLAQLQSAGVECVDLFRVFAETRTNVAGFGRPQLYLTQDSHWSPAGVALAAQAVARRLVEKGWVKPGAMEYGERSAPAERLGDVLRMLQVPRLERCATPENVGCVQVVRRDNAQAYQDDPNSTILILGDSFLRIYEQDEPGSAGFIAHLAKELKQPLTSLVSDGGASTLVRQEMHRRPALLKNKRVVVWEFVERDIHLGNEGWQSVPLPAVAGQPRPDDLASFLEPRSSRPEEGLNFPSRRMSLLSSAPTNPTP
jgi:SGNH hydrolase-like domain, acetyltransferase AlgX